MAETCAPDRIDLVAVPRTQLVLWRLPTAAIIASSVVKDSPLKAGIWTVAFGQMGVACLVNATRCGRLHCYFTGPLFLLGSVASALRGLRLLPLSWDQLGVTMLFGWLIFGRPPERLWGKYAEWAG